MPEGAAIGLGGGGVQGGAGSGAGGAGVDEAVGGELFKLCSCSIISSPVPSSCSSLVSRARIRLTISDFG